MLETQYQRFAQKYSKNQLKSKKDQQMLKETNKLIPRAIQSTLNKLLKVHHRRKYQLVQQKQSFIPLIPRRSEHYQSYEKHIQKESSLKKNKRHTHNVTQLRDLLKWKDNCQKLTSLTGVTRTRIKQSMNISQTQNIQLISTSKTGFKFKEKDNKRIKQKSQKSQSSQHPKTVKKLQRCSEIMDSFDNLADQPSFLDLIKKFKFQNLKSCKGIIPETLYSPPSHHTHIKVNEKRPNLFSQLAQYSQNCKKERNQDNINKKMMKTQYQLQKNKSKLNRKISSLTPWQLMADNGPLYSIQLIDQQ